MSGHVVRFSKGDVIDADYIDFGPVFPKIMENLFPNLDSNPHLKKILFGNDKENVRKMKIAESKNRRQGKLNSKKARALCVAFSEGFEKAFPDHYLKAKSKKWFDPSSYHHTRAEGIVMMYLNGELKGSNLTYTKHFGKIDKTIVKTFRVEDMDLAVFKDYIQEIMKNTL